MNPIDPHQPDDLTSEASRWFARIHSDQVMSADEEAFAAWLEADTKHREAYEEVSGVWSALGGLRSEPAMAPLLKHLSTTDEERPNRRNLLRFGAAGLGVGTARGPQALHGNRPSGRAIAHDPRPGR